MKFSIRDLLLVTVIVALAVGWGADHWRLGERNRWLNGRQAAEQAGSQMAQEVIAALEKKIDEIDPGWRRPTDLNPRGYYVLPGPRISASRQPNSSAPAPKLPKD